MNRIQWACLTILILIGWSASSASAQKEALSHSIDQGAESYWDAALDIWNWAEPGYQETQSSLRLQTMLRDAGFLIEAGVAGAPTAFTATFGEGKPVIGILGEFDSLPLLSQDSVPFKQPRQGAPTDNGHACGHHLFGVASAAAAISISEQIKTGQITGTIRFYGTPAEEGGSGKVYFVREGLMKDCDAVLHWHPGSENAAGDPTTLSRIAVKFKFYGVSAHAAGAPEQGRSALDAVELTNYAAQLLREHTPDFTRIHHVITAGGGAPNVVPDFAEAFYYVRHPDATIVKDIYRRLLLCAEAGATATETRLEVEYLGGIHNIIPSDTLAAVTMKNLSQLADLKYTTEEIEFAEKIQETLLTQPPLDSIGEVKDKSGSTNKGSTDVGDVSWVVPTTGFNTATWVPGTPAHSWQAVAAGGTEIARKGMILAAKVLAATAWDLYHSPETLQNARAELDRRLEGKTYDAMLEPGQMPPLNYRNPSKGK